MGLNMEDKELVECLILHWKGERIFYFFLIVVINGLICINSDIGLDTCAKGGEGRRCFVLQSLANQGLKSP